MGEITDTIINQLETGRGEVFKFARAAEFAVRQLRVLEGQLAEARSINPLWRPVRGNKPDIPHDPDELVLYHAGPRYGCCVASELGLLGAEYWMPYPPPPRR